MQVHVSASLASLCAIVLSCHTASAQNMIKIEQEPLYGAIVSEEQGVRVIRALPSHRKIVTNPEANAPLTIRIDERGTVSRIQHQSK